MSFSLFLYLPSTYKWTTGPFQLCQPQVRQLAHSAPNTLQIHVAVSPAGTFAFGCPTEATGPTSKLSSSFSGLTCSSSFSFLLVNGNLHPPCCPCQNLGDSLQLPPHPCYQAPNPKDSTSHIFGVFPIYSSPTSTPFLGICLP